MNPLEPCRALATPAALAFLGAHCSAQAASLDDNWDSRFGVPGANGAIWAICIHGPDVYVGGSFTEIGGVPANNVAKWNGTNWSALGAGVSGGFLPEIHALIFIGADLYAGGFFSQAGDAASQGVAKWDGSNWMGLAGGVSGGVRALAVTQGKLIAGGSFTSAGGVNMPNIAAWDGTNWTAMGSGIPGTAVDSLAAKGTTIYAGGRFRIAGINATNITMWNGIAWLALGEGIRDWDQAGGGGGLVRTLLATDSGVIAGGTFRLAGVTSALNIAQWDGSAWRPLGGGIDAAGGVYGLALNGSDLYVGGYFGSAGGSNVNDVAEWDGLKWSSLGSGIGDRFFSATVLSLAALGSELLVGGGDITIAGGKPAFNVAMYHIPHSLKIERAQNGVTLSWPATGTNFLLEACAEVGQTEWQGVPEAPVIVGSQCVVTKALGPDNQFFRLRRR